MKLAELSALAWPAANLDEALEALARRAGLPCQGGPVSARDPLATDAPQEAQDEWLRRAAGRLGLEAESVAAPVPQFGRLLRRAAPAIIRCGEAEARYLLLLKRQGRQVCLLGPDGRTRSIPIAALRAQLCADLEGLLSEELNGLLAAAGLSARRRPTALRVLLDERLAGEIRAGCWLLRLPAEVSLWRFLLGERLPQRLAWIVAIFAVIYAMEIHGWGLMGRTALDGRLDFGWFAAWILLILSLLPLDLLGQWCNARFSLDAGRILKQRLLAGVLRLDLQTVRSQGAGQLLSRVIESQALESLLLNGGFAVLLAVVELVFAGWVLSLGAGGALHAAALVMWLSVVLALGWRYGQRLRRWTDDRLDLTHDLIERMTGHRTCLAQEPAEGRERRQDRELLGFFQTSRQMDDAALPLADFISRGWMIVGVVGLAPGFLASTATPAAVAISLGGVMLASRALTKISGGTAALARAWIAWERIAELFHAARLTSAPACPAAAAPLAADGVVMEARGLGFRYRPHDEAVLRDCDLTIRRGDRILLEGPSGGGKSTLASILVGLREASSGLLLLRGLDRHTLQDDWRRHAAAAPQFHENHIFSGSLAFNLLMGRGWPAGNDAIAEAEALCRELGLGELLDRMPSGIMQIVGETGWQLSHGERSRVYLARALLQKADLTVLDESFAALDPESLRQCLDCTLKHAETLMVIAHP